MEIFLEVSSSMSIFGCLSIELTESKLHCNGNIYIEENIEVSVLEANGEWEFDMPVFDFGVWPVPESGITHRAAHCLKDSSPYLTFYIVPRTWQTSLFETILPFII